VCRPRNHGTERVSDYSKTEVPESGIGGTVASPGLHCRSAKHVEPFLITCPGLHTPLGTHGWKSLEMKADKSLQKNFQFEIALPGASPRAGKLQIKLSKMPE